MRRLDGAVFLSGMALMGLEIVGSRVLAPVFGTSIFVWGALITTFLASLAAGYALGGRVADRWPRPRLLADLLTGSGVLLWVLFMAPALVLEAFSDAPVPDRFRSLLAAVVLFGPPSVLMGAVTPFAVRLATRELASVGSSTGRLSAISTAGSILGTFATAFFLIPLLPTRAILFGLGMTLVAASALVPGTFSPLRLVRDGALIAGGAAIYLLTGSVGAPPAQVGALVYEKETAYHHIRVIDRGFLRFFYFDKLAQGFIPSRANVEAPSNYSDGLALSLIFPSRPVRSAVSIGLGAGMVPTLLTRRAPEIALTTIEIDPEVVEVAKRYFGFATDGNDRVILGDGRRELERQISSTDVILIDAYFADSIPFHLLTKEFDTLCRQRLTAEGVLAANFAGTLTGRRNALFWAAVKTLGKVFPRVYVFSAELAAGKGTFQGSAIVIASRSPTRLDRGTIADRARTLADRLRRPPIAEWGTKLYDGEMLTADVPVLTDAYSPTDALQHLNLGREPR